ADAAAQHAQRSVRVIRQSAHQSIVRARHQLRLGTANPSDIFRLWQSRQTSRRNRPEERAARLNADEQSLGRRIRHRRALPRGRKAVLGPDVCSSRFNPGTLPRWPWYFEEPPENNAERAASVIVRKDKNGFVVK